MVFPIDSQSAKSASLLEQGDQFIKSNEPADPDGDKDVSYGQNGFNGASSDLPGKRTTSGFLPELEPTKGLVENRFKDDGWQTRKVPDAPLAFAHGQKPSVQPNVFSAPTRPVTTRGK